MTEAERAQAIIKGMCADKPEGAVYQRDLSETHEVLVFPSLFGAALLCVAIKGVEWSQDHYDYPKMDDAIRAAVEWDGKSDPLDGWVRHLASGRRRPDGTRASEKFEP